MSQSRIFSQEPLYFCNQINAEEKKKYPHTIIIVHPSFFLSSFSTKRGFNNLIFSWFCCGTSDNCFVLFLKCFKNDIFKLDRFFFFFEHSRVYYIHHQIWSDKIHFPSKIKASPLKSNHKFHNIPSCSLSNQLLI